ncbi:MAG: response regulator transcription factor [Bdellovibrionia bacterium]
MNHLLIVEDSEETTLILKKSLGGKDSELTFAATAEKALALLAARDFSLVLLDVSLPDQDGFQVFTEMRGSERLRNVPVIFLSANSQDTTKVAAFSMGAEDYVVKPFSPIELRARVEAKLRKATIQNQETQALLKGDLRLDSSTQRAYSLGDGVRTLIRFTPREFKLLFQLAKNEELALSREQLLNAVWGNSSEVFDRAVDTHISSIRKKLGSLAIYIESVPGLGYRFSSSSKKSSKQRAA